MDPGVGDIVERESPETPPAPPKPGGPKAFNKKWVSRKRPVVLDPTAGQPTPRTTEPQPATPQASKQPETPLSEPERIHLENIRKLQHMSPEEIEREREEIFKVMDPGVLQSLLRRAELKEEESRSHRKPKSQPGPEPVPKPVSEAVPKVAGQSAGQSGRPSTAKPSSTSLKTPLAPPKGTAVQGVSAPDKGAVADWDPAPDASPNAAGLHTGTDVGRDELKETEADKETEESEHAHSSLHSHTEPLTTHFPPPPDELRKFFPDLPVETEKLAWMQPIDESEEAEYSASLTSVAPSELRFDFNGNLVTPRQSRNISTKAGLHHHGDAPSAAGYTLPELAHLSRSSHSSQRALAIQTAGRVLHKLRLRKFARSSELQEGLEALVTTTRIMETLEEAADEKTRSLTVRTLATEALWLAKTSNGPRESK